MSIHKTAGPLVAGVVTYQVSRIRINFSLFASFTASCLPLIGPVLKAENVIITAPTQATPKV